MKQQSCQWRFIRKRAAQTGCSFFVFLYHSRRPNGRHSGRQIFFPVFIARNSYKKAAIPFGIT